MKQFIHDLFGEVNILMIVDPFSTYLKSEKKTTQLNNITRILCKYEYKLKLL